MSDYIGQAERLRNWNVLDIQNHPALTVGMLRSAGAAIERLSDEVYRLNRENFWLSRNQKIAGEGKRIVELPPVDVGDVVWCVGSSGGCACIRSGKVSRLEVADGRVTVCVYGVGSGVYGKRVFGTKEEAMAAVVGGDKDDA